MVKKGFMLVGAAMLLSACIGEKKEAKIWPRSGDVIYAAEMHVYCAGDRDLRFIGPFRDMEEGKKSAQSLRSKTLEEVGGQDYRVNFWMVRRYVHGANDTPRIQRAKVDALSCV